MIAYALCGLSNLRNKSLFAARMRISQFTFFKPLNFTIMETIYVVSTKQIINEVGKFVGDKTDWITTKAFRSHKHAEMEIKELKSLECEKEIHAYVIEEITLK